MLGEPDIGFNLDLKPAGPFESAPNECGDARLMIAEADGAFDPEAQGIIFYLYTRDLDTLRARLVDAGVEAPEITTGGPGPDRQLELT